MNNKSHVEPLRQIPLLGDGWQPKKGQPLPWEIKRKLFKPKGGRNKKGADNNFHNRDYDFVSPDGQIFTGKGVRQFAQAHGLNENCLLDLLNGRLHSHKGWKKAIGGKKLPIPPTYYFLSPEGVIHTTTNLTQFAHEHGLCAIALSRMSRCIFGLHKGWHHCDRDGNIIKPSDKKHRKFRLLSPTGEIVEGSNLKAFAEENKLTRTCLMNVLDGTSREHKGWKLPETDTGDLKAEKFSKDSWNPEDFGDVPHKVEEDGQATIFFDVNEPPEPDDFATVEKFEEAWERWNSLQGTSSVAEVVIAKERSPQDISQSGQSKTIPTPQPSTESDFQIPDSSKQISPNSTTNSLEVSQPQTLLLEEVLARISLSLAIAPGLKAIAQACFISSSDSFKSSSLQLFAGKTLLQSCQVEKGKTSSKSLMRLHRWGMWGTGKCETATDTSPKIESASSLWVFTGDIRATTPKLRKKSLTEILGAISINSATKKPIHEAFTLRSSTPKQGVGNGSHPNTFVLHPVILDVHHASGGRLYEEESPCLLSPGEGGRKFSVVYRAADGDRIYSEQAPCLRSQKDAGTGAYKIREYNGETYFERPINGTEAEQLMGWEAESTTIGINSEGDEITISQTQRIKVLGNGIIPGEITDILTAIKPILEQKLLSEVPQGYGFAYRQLRGRMGHEDAINLLSRQT